jgi:hypothetical protein
MRGIMGGLAAKKMRGPIKTAPAFSQHIKCAYIFDILCVPAHFLSIC